MCRAAEPVLKRLRNATQRKGKSRNRSWRNEGTGCDAASVRDAKPEGEMAKVGWPGVPIKGKVRLAGLGDVRRKVKSPQCVKTERSSASTSSSTACRSKCRWCKTSTAETASRAQIKYSSTILCTMETNMVRNARRWYNELNGELYVFRVRPGLKMNSLRRRMPVFFGWWPRNLIQKLLGREEGRGGSLKSRVGKRDKK